MDKTTGQIRYQIYQLKDVEENLHLCFVAYEKVKGNVRFQNYDLVYEGVLKMSKMDIELVLEFLFQKFNCHHPADFTGRSLSVSDVVVLDYDGEERAFYCDDIGFKEVPEFLVSGGAQGL